MVGSVYLYCCGKGIVVYTLQNTVQFYGVAAELVWLVRLGTVVLAKSGWCPLKSFLSIAGDKEKS